MEWNTGLDYWIESFSILNNFLYCIFRIEKVIASMGECNNWRWMFTAVLNVSAYLKYHILQIICSGKSFAVFMDSLAIMQNFSNKIILLAITRVWSSCNRKCFQVSYSWFMQPQCFSTSNKLQYIVSTCIRNYLPVLNHYIVTIVSICTTSW